MKYVHIVCILCFIVCWNSLSGRSTRKRRSRTNNEETITTISEPPTYRWDEIKPIEPTSRSSRIRGLIDQRKSVNASTKTRGLPVYIAMTTISSRVNKIENTIISLLNGDVLADRIYLFISSEPFLLDAGRNDVFYSSPLLHLISSSLTSYSRYTCRSIAIITFGTIILFSFYHCIHGQHGTSSKIVTVVSKEMERRLFDRHV